jgi:hypothetical protein
LNAVNAVVLRLSNSNDQFKIKTGKGFRMRKFPKISSILLVFGLIASVSAALPADKLINEAKQKAQAEGKNVFLIFSTTGCSWCKVLNKFLDSDDVKPIFTKHFVPVHLMLGKDENTNSGAEVFEKKYGPAEGVPYHVFLKPNGEKIVDSKEDGTGQNIGYPAQANEIAWFIKMVKKAAPQITAKEITTLEDKLKSFRKS